MLQPQAAGLERIQEEIELPVIRQDLLEPESIISQARDVRMHVLNQAAKTAAARYYLRVTSEPALRSSDPQVVERVLALINERHRQNSPVRQRAIATVSSFKATINKPTQRIGRLPPGKRRAVKRAVERAGEATDHWVVRLRELDKYEEVLIRRLADQMRAVRQGKGRAPPDPWPPE